MSTAPPKPTRREQRRVQTIDEIKALAMDQIRLGGPDAVSLSGIVREMSMSPAAVYRYFENRDALLSELVVDAYNDFADFIASAAAQKGSSAQQLTAALSAGREWALAHPNSYRLIFQTEVGSGHRLDVDRTRSAATRSMAAIITTLAAVGSGQSHPTSKPLAAAIDEWSAEAGLAAFSTEVLALGLLSWTRLHGIISLELGGHLAATGLDPTVLFDAEVAEIARAAAP